MEGGESRVDSEGGDSPEQSLAQKAKRKSVAGARADAGCAFGGNLRNGCGCGSQRVPSAWIPARPGFLLECSGPRPHAVIGRPLFVS